MADRDNTTNWRDIVYHGVETQELDYKAAQNWVTLSRVGKAKFARHAMAMANTRGGYIVVGVSEEERGNPTGYTGLTDAQLKSFDPSICGQFINLYADPSIDVDVVRPEVDGRHYVIFVIRRFSGLPHVSTDHCGDEIQQGAFYIRTSDARSRPAYRASELHGLVQRALRNQRQALGRMLRGVLYEGKQVAEPDAELEFQRQAEGSVATCRGWLGPRRMGRYINLTVTAYPTEFKADGLVLSEIKRLVEGLPAPMRHRLPLLPGNDGETFMTNEALMSRQVRESGAGFFFMQVFQSRLFHHVSSVALGGEQAAVTYPVLVERIASAIQVLGELYSELGGEDELLTFTVGLSNVKSCRLIETPETKPRDEPYKCYIPDIMVRMRRTVADMLTGTEVHAARVIAEVCERFNFDARQHDFLRQQLRKMLAT